MASTLEILKRLTAHKVEFVVVGGMAGVAHGSSYVTEDVDVCAPFSPENLARIVEALRGLNPCWRMQPRRPPLQDDPAALSSFHNLYLVTELGQVDFLDEIMGVGSYEEVRKQSIEMQLGGAICRVIDLDSLIRAKRALGRAKDVPVAVELEAIRERLRRKP